MFLLYAACRRSVIPDDARTAAPARWVSGLVAAWVALSPLAASAADPEFQLAIKDHRYVPAELRVPAGTKVRLVVHNQDATPEEFESVVLNREKIIPAGGKATVFIGPLKPGRYEFTGEYNEATAKGVIIAE